MLIRRWTVVEDKVLHSRETADASWRAERPLVLLHGVGTTSRYYRPLLRALDGEAPAAAVELPGIGSSSRRHVPDDVAGQAEVVAGWLRATRRHPVVLVGNSMGAQTAVEVALHAPELVDALVLLGPTVDVAARSAPRQLGRLLVDATYERPGMLAVAATDSFLTRRSAVLRYFRASLRHPIEERIGFVTVPVVLVRGSADPLAPRCWVRRLAAMVAQGSVVEIPYAAHACHHGQPRPVAALLLAVRDGTVARYEVTPVADRAAGGRPCPRQHR